jgi:hypothetical protein
MTRVYSDTQPTRGDKKDDDGMVALRCIDTVSANERFYNAF